jgi:translation initiation factor 4G
MERGDDDMILKLITLGNIRLIGELMKARMVPEKIVHHIIKVHMKKLTTQLSFLVSIF